MYQQVMTWVFFALFSDVSFRRGFCTWLTKNQFFIEKISEDPDLPKLNKFWDIQKWFTKTLDLRHRPSTRTTCTSELKKYFGLLMLPPKMRFRLAASAAKLAATAAALPPPCCHRHAAAAYTAAKLLTPPTPRSCQAATAATAAAKLAAVPALSLPLPSPSLPSLSSSLSSPPFPCF